MFKANPSKGLMDKMSKKKKGKDHKKPVKKSKTGGLNLFKKLGQPVDDSDMDGM
jgi:hypothetical protein